MKYFAVHVLSFRVSIVIKQAIAGSMRDFIYTHTSLCAPELPPNHNTNLMKNKTKQKRNIHKHEHTNLRFKFDKRKQCSNFLLGRVCVFFFSLGKNFHMMKWMFCGFMEMNLYSFLKTRKNRKLNTVCCLCTNFQIKIEQ